MTLGRTSVLLLLLLGFTVACGRPSPPASGQVLYERYCASCHGVAGRGDGPAAGALTPSPTDLTSLAADVPHLMQVIDGRQAVRAHGSSAMPVWGTVLSQAHADAHTQRTVLLEVQALAEHAARLASAGRANQ